MGYVAIQGGVQAIERAEVLSKYLRLRGPSLPLSVEQIQEQLGLLVDRVMSEGGLYSPFHAALALKQSQGDPAEAAFYVRAYRSTLRRLADSLPLATREMRLARRISSAFKTIPGGQLLGATPDYRQRILDFALAAETAAGRAQAREDCLRSLQRLDSEPAPERCPKVLDLLREQGLAPQAAEGSGQPEGDVTREAPAFPVSRGLRLQMLSRAETGAVQALAYSSMRGYGDIHPTIGELRVGEAELRLPHPHRPNQSVCLGYIRLTEVEIVAEVHRQEGEPPRFSLGYGACFGHNELKAISTAVLDRTLQAASPQAPAEDQEFVLLHSDGVESAGFCSHFKLPHYVTFQSALERLRESQRISADPLEAAIRGGQP
jgi:alpha-D-ribose 1-methylphosphonate 5-triphosphate synthase subunit PhnI